jgi:hypothetical protein
MRKEELERLSGWASAAGAIRQEARWEDSPCSSHLLA